MLHGAARPAIACNLLASCLLGREGRGRLGPCGRGAESMVSEVCRLPAVMAGGTADVIQDEAWQQGGLGRVCSIPQLHPSAVWYREILLSLGG